MIARIGTTPVMLQRQAEHRWLWLSRAFQAAQDRARWIRSTVPSAAPLPPGQRAASSPPSTVWLRRSPVTQHPVLGNPLWVWALLFLNVLAYTGDHPTVIPLPGVLAQMITQSAVYLALIVALIINPGRVIRPNLVLGLLSLNAVMALAVAPHSDFVAGSLFRSVRLVAFLAVLWLLTPWWGRRGMPLLRVHLSLLWVIIGSVLLGAVLAPGKAFSFENRLAGAIWPIPPTQVAHYAAILFGCTVVLWFCREVSGRSTLIAVVLCGLALALTHTRTALTGLVVGLIMAGASLAVGHARVRRVAAITALTAGVLGAAFSSALLSWALRGQNTQEAAQLTGRTKVWTAIVETPRTLSEQLFGSGLANKSFDGLPIDSNWMASYVEIGWFGIVVQLAVLAVVAQMILVAPRGPERAVALMIMSYLVIASVTETGLCDASPYVLELVVAASVLAGARRRPMGDQAGVI